MEWIQQFFEGDFFYWFYSTLVQAFAAMIAVLGMLIIHSIQVRRQDKIESIENRKKSIIEIYIKYKHPRLQHLNELPSVPEIMQIAPELYLGKIIKRTFENFRYSNIKELTIFQEKLEPIKISELKIKEIDKKYNDTIGLGWKIMKKPFWLFLSSLIGLLISNVFAKYTEVGAIITILFTIFIIYIVYNIMERTISLIRTGTDYTPQEELEKQAKREVEKEIEKLKVKTEQ